GPLFFIFLLFNQTKDMFDNWLKAMTGFGLQQIFLLTTLAFFNMLFIEVLKISLGYGVCWDDAWVINLGVRFTVTKFWVISSLPPRTSMSDDLMETGNPESIPSLFSILYIWVVASLMKKMVTFMTDVASTISDGIKASEIGQGIAAIGSQIKGMGAKAANNAFDSIASRVDDKLFDSGKIAKQKRNSREEQAKSDMAARKTLLSAADEAEKKYKADPDNIAKLGDMSKEDQQKDIQRVRREAMDKKAAKMNIKGKNKERIINDAGLKYQGNNVFGAIKQAGKQAIFKGGALKRSIAERDVQTRINKGDALNAVKDMDSKQASKFAKDVTEDRLNVSKTRFEKISTAISSGFNKLTSNDSNITKIAINQLEHEGKIAKTGSTSLNSRNDDEQKMIRDRIKLIRDKGNNNKKVFAKEVSAISSKAIKKRFNKKKQSLQRAIGKAIEDNDLDKFNRLSEIDEAITNAEYGEDDENSDNANELIDDFNKTDFDKNESIEELMNKDSFKNFKDKN
ncbi:MAG: type IV secretion system protein, partial [Alphaproteobacteria bacterium]